MRAAISQGSIGALATKMPSCLNGLPGTTATELIQECIRVAFLDAEDEMVSDCKYEDIVLLSLWRFAHRLKSCVVRVARDLKRTNWFVRVQIFSFVGDGLECRFCEKVS